ncbi:hypothetical protein [Flavobacterium microcysteis]|uniref:Uncharacterized protein n=1 Tax=Flavobacterium microcysteis TaxID=2596891 RepID=A0A501QE16_9FLAO|nr:hypothetical protein [Flavobacterium microcysteis]TPD71119.1 hypothetical protein FJA49_04255 [Flavobacterium microcysteis]
MKDIIGSVGDSEDSKTSILFDYFKDLSNQNFLNKEQLLKILMWKSPRPLNLYMLNSEEEIKEITTLAFSLTNDKLKIHTLTALKGVSYPAASAILMFYNPILYPVLDIRVWRQLYNSKLLDSNPKGQNFTLIQCENYYEVIRSLALDLNLTARQVEKRIFDYDKKNQVGTLYKTK